MISDVLSDALFQIEGWQLHSPEAYGAWAEMTPERWAEAMISKIVNEPGFFRELNPLVYRITRAEVVRQLGERHPLIERLAVVEAGAGQSDIGPPRAE